MEKVLAEKHTKHSDLMEAIRLIGTEEEAKEFFKDKEVIDALFNEAYGSSILKYPIFECVGYWAAGSKLSTINKKANTKLGHYIIRMCARLITKNASMAMKKKDKKGHTPFFFLAYYCKSAVLQPVLLANMKKWNSSVFDSEAQLGGKTLRDVIGKLYGSEKYKSSATPTSKLICKVAGAKHC